MDPTEQYGVVYVAHASVYEIKDGALYRNNQPLIQQRGGKPLVFGSVPLLNYDYVPELPGRPAPIHRKFGGPRLDDQQYICDLLLRQADVDRIIVVMNPEFEGSHWKQMKSGIKVLDTQSREPAFGKLRAYSMISNPILMLG